MGHPAFVGNQPTQICFCAFPGLKIETGGAQHLSLRYDARRYLHVVYIPRKLRIIWWPPSVSTLSGWNCTPSMGRLRWRSPMMTDPPPLGAGVRAVTVSSAGSDSSATISE